MSLEALKQQLQRLIEDLKKAGRARNPMIEENSLFNEQKKLVLARFRTLNPDGKIMLGEDKEVTVKELVGHIELGDEFGKNVIKAQMKMLRVLAHGAE